MIAGVSYKIQHGTFNVFDQLALDMYFGNIQSYAGLGWPQQAQGGVCWWCDAQGKILFDRWRNGGGELSLDDPELWGNYMRAHASLRDAIEIEIAGKAGNKSGAFKGVMSYDFGGGYMTGCQMLGGSNSRVGGLAYSGYLSVNGDELNYNVNLVWNDIMNPIDSRDDRFGAWVFPGTTYTVHVIWSYDFTFYNLDKK